MSSVGIVAASREDSRAEVYWYIHVCYHCVWCVHVQRFTLKISQYCTGRPTAQGAESGACFNWMATLFYMSP